MVRVLFAFLSCVFASSQAPAHNDTSQMLLALRKDERNQAFTHLLRERNKKCDRVIRTLFGGTALGLDDWEVVCHDRNSYSLSITPELNPSIELVSCHELVATSKRLLHRVGSKSKAMGCK